jgi:hypothetical protein
MCSIHYFLPTYVEKMCPSLEVVTAPDGHPMRPRGLLKHIVVFMFNAKYKSIFLKLMQVISLMAKPNNAALGYKDEKTELLRNANLITKDKQQLARRSPFWAFRRRDMDFPLSQSPFRESNYAMRRRL